MVGDEGKRAPGMELVVSESRGLYSRKWNYVISPDDEVGGNRNFLHRVPDDVNHHGSGNKLVTNWFNDLRLTIRQVFLPHGYPDSVSCDYLNYQIYDTIQAFCSSLTGALATEAVMKGVGVGDEAATPLAAALTWLLKSGSGMIGQIIFTWAQGTSLDGDCKKWRFFADAINDAAIFIDLLTPALHPDLRIGVFCISSVARSLVGVAGGATRAAITQHQARCNNTADVSAKDGSQETLVNLVALITSLFLLPAVSGNHQLIWTLYIFFTAFHLFANYKALKSLMMESLNNSRLLLCLSQFLEKGTVPSIKEVNNRESILLGCGIRDTGVTSNGYRIRMGVSIASAARELDCIKDLIVSAGDRHFLILPRPDTKTINVILEEGIQPWELVEAYCRSIFLTYHLNANIMSAMSDKCTKDWLKLEAALSTAGFLKDRALLETADWRASWKKFE